MSEAGYYTCILHECGIINQPRKYPISLRNLWVNWFVYPRKLYTSKSSAIYIIGTIYVIGIAKEVMCNTIYIIVCYGNQHMLHLGSLTSMLCSRPFCFGEPAVLSGTARRIPISQPNSFCPKVCLMKQIWLTFNHPKQKMGGCMHVVVHNDLQSPHLNLGWLQW